MRTQILDSIHLRPYQEKCVKRAEMIFDLVCPVSCYGFVLPTGAGKSVIIGAIIHSILKTFEWDDLSILVCSWSRRIIKQDFDKCMSLNDRVNVDYMQLGNNKYFAINKKSSLPIVDFCTVQALPNFNTGKTYDVIIVD